MDYAVAKLHIHSKNINPFIPFEDGKSETSVGTAFFISDTMLLTCYHCINEHINMFISLPQRSRKEYKVVHLASIPEYDISLIEIVDKIDHTQLELGNSQDVQQLDNVIVLGYPLDSDSLKYTKGIISGKFKEFIQTDAPINEGNSGGPLLKDGKVIAINSGKFTIGENMGLSIPLHKT